VYVLMISLLILGVQEFIEADCIGWTVKDEGLVMELR
jgi:hypothetical protein